MIPKSPGGLGGLARFTCLAATLPLAAGTYQLDQPSADRWMYPANSTPGSRAQASTFSALPASSGQDDRYGFFLMAFDTAALIPPGLDPDNYQIESITLTATIGQDGLFTYDPTADPVATYSTPDSAATLADADTGRPLELHGAGFRNDYTAATYAETDPYGDASPGNRNAFPLGYDSSGSSRDVSNNVTDGFESIPWSVGTAPLTPGAAVPLDTVFTFEIDLTLPGVAGYLRQSLSDGKIWLALSSLHPAVQSGGEFVSYYTSNDFLHQLVGGYAPALAAQITINHPLTLTIDPQTTHRTLTWPQAAGFTYQLQTSSTLTHADWTTIHSRTATEPGTATFTDPDALDHRFYRLAILPAS
ncbi:MAG: hypothetical protein ACQCXQ_15490 [Verrucomicrobiales bacterium]|nr:hypothetical protein [Verrucomicrobiota bacterium JB025]